MKFSLPGLAIAAALGLIPLAPHWAGAEETRVTFPDLDVPIHYTTVTRGNVTEHMPSTQDAIEAVQAGRPIPDGTHVVLVDYREGEVYRFFVMERGAGWSNDYDERRRTGDWQYQFYWGDRSVNMEENTARCQRCHQSRAGSEYMYTYNDLRRFEQ
ncbi:cytochrome P460 family protein [Paracoccus sp. (in: a-proteobacteria)]|uniref:cytochrome P460 family protein n=1 Tax=Paracoccus sp. TaxID=267 RepID=UPI0028AEC507|nr:cytochrome P460 family protein [Paracoccus sp. (in: a-proteobacteria)]